MEVVGQINIDFDVYSNSPQGLTIFDNSDWIYSENLPAYLLITLPGSTKTINYTFYKNRINSLNSHNLGISCLSGDCTEEVYVDLPDGIYTICLKSSFEDLEATKYYLKTDRFELEHAKVLIKYGTEYNKTDRQFIEHMTFITFLLRVAKANAMTGDFIKAQRYFQEAKKLLKLYVECNDCL